MTHTNTPPSEPAMRLGFARGMAPDRWEERWRRVSQRPLTLVPRDVAFGRETEATVDVMLERTAPGERPAGSTGEAPTRHALRLYTESVALIVAKHHELAQAAQVDSSDIALVPLLGYPEYPAAWPDPHPLADPSWAPADLSAALEAVAAGGSAVLLPRPLARHLTRGRDHAVIPVAADALPGTTVWASWDRARDNAEVQLLVGVLRGRTARSSRGPADAGGSGGSAPGGAGGSAPPVRTPKRAGKKPLNPNSRGAQLAAAKEKAERERRERRRAKRR